MLTCNCCLTSLSLKVQRPNPAHKDEEGKTVEGEPPTLTKEEDRGYWYDDTSGNPKKYAYADLKYDINSFYFEDPRPKLVVPPEKRSFVLPASPKKKADVDAENVVSSPRKREEQDEAAINAMLSGVAPTDKVRWIACCRVGTD